MGGVYSVNEARNMEDLPTVEYGDEPHVQAQVVPLSAAAAIPAAPHRRPLPPREIIAKPFAVTSRL